MSDGTGAHRSPTTRRRLVLSLLVAAMLVGSTAEPVAAAWKVAADGRCVEYWTPASLGRGPTALLMAPTAIPRAVAGAITSMSTLRKDSPSGSSIAASPLLVFFWGANGFVEMLIWMGTGVVDTVTGGALSLAPDDAVELSLSPLTYAPVAKPPTTDPCGRPLK